MSTDFLSVFCLVSVLVAGGWAAATPATGAAPVAQAGGPADTTLESPATLDLQSQHAFDANTVLMQFDVREDGDAAARVEYRMWLDDANSTDAFERLRRDVENNTTQYTNRFAERVRTTAATAENATGREMAVENVSVEARTEQLPQTYGVIAYSFTWRGFAATEGGTLEVGEALGGLYLDNKTRLLVSWPDGFEATTVASNADERLETAAVWAGPQYFGPNGPRVVLRPAGLLPGNLPFAAVAAVGALALAGGATWWWRSTREPGADSGGGQPAPPGSTAETTAARATAGAPNEPATEDEVDQQEGQATADETASQEGPTTADEAASQEGQATADEAGPQHEPDQPPELMSNEERVLWVVERNDGRVKQQEVVEALDWSEARTSRVVGNLREDGRIDSFRLGNENVLALPEDEEP